ncbi:MAG: DUF4197 domain-containing protein [Pseudomonadota bacterium]
MKNAIGIRNVCGRHLFAGLLLLGLVGCESQALQDILTSQSSSSDSTIAAGLREALTVGSKQVVSTLGSEGGFSLSPSYRIPLPESLATARSMANTVGLGGYFDTLENKMNEAAEAATPKAQELFLGAIRQLTFTDVMDIYQGGDKAATTYLEDKTSSQLGAEMRPVIERSLNEVGAYSTFNTLIERYNALPLVSDIDADLTGHVVRLANDAIFSELGKQETAIRQDPARQTTALLRQVFGSGG